MDGITAQIHLSLLPFPNERRFDGHMFRQWGVSFDSLSWLELLCLRGVSSLKVSRLAVFIGITSWGWILRLFSQ